MKAGRGRGGQEPGGWEAHVLLRASHSALEYCSVGGLQGRKGKLRLVWERETKDIGKSFGKKGLIYSKKVWLAFLATEQLFSFNVISPGYMVEHT